jgi:hypothetical protein
MPRNPPFSTEPQAPSTLPAGWKRAKYGAAYTLRANITCVIHQRHDGYRWVWTSWRSKESFEAPQGLPTVAEAIVAAEKALPEARRALVAPATFPEIKRPSERSEHPEPDQPKQPTGRKFWWLE